MYTNIKIANRKKLQLKILVDSEYTYTRINKQLVKIEQIEIEPMNRLFKIFNTNRTKNRGVMRFALLELEINGHTEKINTVVMNLNNIDIFLGYSWLIKHNPEILANLIFYHIQKWFLTEPNIVSGTLIVLLLISGSR